MSSILIDIIKKDITILWWLKSVFYMLRIEQKSISVEHLLTLNKKYNEDDIKSIIFILEEMGILKTIKKNINLYVEEYIIYYDRFDKLIYEAEAIINFIENTELQYNYTITANLPGSLNQNKRFSIIRSKTIPIYDTVLDLIDMAKEEIIIINPFFDVKGIEIIKNEILSKLKSNVTVKIITRYLKESESSNRKLLLKLFETDNFRERLSLYDYCYNGNVNGSTTFHAKAIIIDKGLKAYIGSANITGWGLEEQFELGVLLEDKNANLLYEIVCYLEEENIIKQVKIKDYH